MTEFSIFESNNPIRVKFDAVQQWLDEQDEETRLEAVDAAMLVYEKRRSLMARLARCSAFRVSVLDWEIQGRFLFGFELFDETLVLFHASVNQLSPTDPDGLGLPGVLVVKKGDRERIFRMRAGRFAPSAVLAMAAATPVPAAAGATLVDDLRAPGREGILRHLVGLIASGAGRQGERQPELSTETRLRRAHLLRRNRLVRLVRLDERVRRHHAVIMMASGAVVLKTASSRLRMGVVAIWGVTFGREEGTRTMIGSVPWPVAGQIARLSLRIREVIGGVKVRVDAFAKAAAPQKGIDMRRMLSRHILGWPAGKAEAPAANPPTIPAARECARMADDRLKAEAGDHRKGGEQPVLTLFFFARLKVEERIPAERPETTLLPCD